MERVSGVGDAGHAAALIVLGVSDGRGRDGIFVPLYAVWEQGRPISSAVSYGER
jgi:hypothetical protein